MALILDDNFNSDSIGSSPSGWSGINGGATIFNFGVPPPHSGANNCVGLKGSILTTVASVSIGVLTFSYLSTENNLLNTICNLKSTGVGGTFNLITIGIEHDFSYSGITISGYLTDIVTSFPANSNIVKGFIGSPDIFNFFQLNFALAENIDHTIQVSMTLLVNGHTVFNATANSGVHTTTGCPASIQTVEFANSTNGFPGSFLDNVALDTDPASSYPYPGNPTTFNALVSQAAIENLQLPNNQPIRMSQLPIELLKLPSDEKIQMSQLVIEIIQGKAAVPAGGWHVKEI